MIVSRLIELSDKIKEVTLKILFDLKENEDLIKKNLFSDMQKGLLM